MTRAPTSLYVLNLALLSTHQADAAYWHEWVVFGVPGGILVAILVTSAAQLSLARRGIT